MSFHNIIPRLHLQHVKVDSILRFERSIRRILDENKRELNYLKNDTLDNIQKIEMHTEQSLKVPWWTQFVRRFRS